MVGNAHLDVVWLWPWQEGYREAVATFRSVLDRMDEFDDFVFTCDQVVLLEWTLEQDPELFERIRQRVEEGRWVDAGGWWVEPDCNIPSGESLARQGLHGQRFLQRHFGQPAVSGLNADPFGHSATLPMILRGQRMGSYSFLRPMAHEKDLPPVFRWRAPDGSEVLAYRIPFEYQTSRESVDRHLEKALPEQQPGPAELMVFFGVGNHGGGPTVHEIETVYRFDRMGTFGALRFSSPDAYFAGLGREVVDALPIVQDDLQHHAVGCYSAHSGVKQRMRRAQSAVLTAERWAAVITAKGWSAYPRDDLERAWKQVLFNQAHDILPGTAIPSAYQDARDQLGEAAAIADRITAKAHAVIANRIDVPFDDTTQPVLVFNPHPWPVTATVELHFGPGSEVDPSGAATAEGEAVLSQAIASTSQVGGRPGGAIAFRAELPPLGYRRYVLPRSAGGGVDRERPPDVGRGLVLENEILRVEIEQGTGRLAGLLDKRTGVDLVAGAAGEHVQICADPTDTWGHRVVSYDWPGASMTTDRVVLRENGPLRGVVRVDRRWNRSVLVEEYGLDRGSDSVEVRVELDWREEAHLMKLRFPVALDRPVARSEIPHGSIERPVTGSEEPGQSWVDLSGRAGDGTSAGLAIVNDAKHGYDFAPAGERHGEVRSASIGITAVRSPVYAWHDPTELVDGDVHEFQDQGRQTFTYRLVPHAGDWRAAGLHRRAAELSMRPRAMLEGFHPGELPSAVSFADEGGTSVMVTAVKGAEDGSGDLVVRALETEGRRAPVEIHLPVADRTVRADFDAHSLRTWRVPVAPARPIVEVDLLEWPLDAPGPAPD